LPVNLIANPEGRVIRHETFLSFIETPPVEGCGWTLDKVERLIKDDVETLAMWRDAVTGPRHVHSDRSNSTITPDRGKAYTVSRLRREAPELYEEMREGRLSANAAAIHAGFRKKPSPFEMA
jgi:hypothetical protein